MNWEAIGAIGEISASVAVLVSLIYIAIQVRETRRAAIRNERLTRSNALSRTILETPQLAEVLEKIGEVDGRHPFCEEMLKTYSLTPAQAELYLRSLAIAWRALETEFLSSGVQGDLEIAVAGQLKTPSSRRFIEIQGWRFNPGFISFVSEVRVEASGKEGPLPESGRASPSS